MQFKISSKKRLQASKVIFTFKDRLLKLQYDLFAIVYHVIQVRVRRSYSHSYPASKIADLYVFYFATQQLYLNRNSRSTYFFSSYLVFFSSIIRFHIFVWLIIKLLFRYNLLVYSHFLYRQNFQHPSSCRKVPEFLMPEAKTRLHRYMEFNNLMNEFKLKKSNKWVWINSKIMHNYIIKMIHLRKKYFQMYYF